MSEQSSTPTSACSTPSCIRVAFGDYPNTTTSGSGTTTASPPGSTPPTSLGDEASVASDAPKLEKLIDGVEHLTDVKHQREDEMDTDAAPAPSETPQELGRRSSRRASGKVPTYNVQILAGTAIHTPTKYLEKHRQNVFRNGVPPPEEVTKTNTVEKVKERVRKAETEATEDGAEEQLATEVAEAHRRRSSRVDLRKEAVLRNKVIATGAALAKMGQEAIASGKGRLQQALGTSSRSTPAKESVKSTLKASKKRSRASLAQEAEASEDEWEDEKEFVKPKVKKWEEHGLYIGQHRGFDARLTESQNRQKRRALQAKENKALPLPMYAGDRLLSTDPKKEWRDFKLPFDTFSPLDRRVKVDGWVKLSKNRFIGDASSMWKKDKQRDESKCYCSPEEGCGISCHNRSMMYECDSYNCNLTAEECGNRPFAELKKRAKGNRYDYGVEVMSTEDRGFGVRAMRTFEPHQIIVEYAGEIITQGECERRMKHEYKKNKCYYLMSFDNKTIIDATRGTIARFVNHSCEPNCEMIKWTVNGEPRMALFAGSRGIMTGEELTYDYNFDPFSSKNIQECKCGTASCRGVLGPKSKDQKDKKSIASSIIAGTKRKIQEALGTKGSRSVSSTPNKRQKFSYMAGVGITKAKNQQAQKAAEQAKAEKEAAEAEAQKASRENRALRRSSSAVTLSKRKVVKKESRQSNPASFKSTKRTTVSVVHKARKPGQLRPVTKTKKLGSAVSRRALAIKEKTRPLASTKLAAQKSTSSRTSSKNLPKSIASPSKLSPKKTLTKTSSKTSTFSKAIPNSPDIAITSSSLRSSSSTGKLRQSTLNFQPISVVRDSEDSLEDPSSLSFSDVSDLGEEESSDDDYMDVDDEVVPPRPVARKSIPAKVNGKRVEKKTHGIGRGKGKKGGLVVKKPVATARRGHLSFN